MNAAVGFSFKLRSLRNLICMTPARSVAHRKAPGQIAHFIDQSPVRIGDVECLY